MNQKKQERNEEGYKDSYDLSLKKWRNLALGYHIFYLIFVRLFLDNWIKDPSPHFAQLQMTISAIGLFLLGLSSYKTQKIKSRMKEREGTNSILGETRNIIYWTYLLFAVLAYQDAHSLYRALERLYDLGF